MNSFKAILPGVAMLSALVGLGAQTPEWQWAQSAGGTGLDYGQAIAVDSQGNQYVTGYFEGTASFGPYTLTASGQTDIFAAKLDPGGNWLWAVRAGGTNTDEGKSIALDQAGNAYLTGSFKGTASFGPYTLTTYDVEQIFVAKIDHTGYWVWAVQAGGADWDWGYGIAVDPAGYACLTGIYFGTASFGPYTLTSTGYEYRDIFAAKLDPEGNWLWAVSAGGISDDGGYDIALDPAGNAYLTGFLYSYTANFGPHTVPPSGYMSFFVAKLDPTGNWLWAVRAVGTSWNEVGGIAVDQAGNAYLTGFFSATASIGPYTLTTDGLMDVFAAKLDSDGDWLWAVRAGGTSFDEGHGIAVDPAGNAFLTGHFGGTASFGPYTVATSAYRDIFSAKLDPVGNWLWVAQAGGTEYDYGRGIAADQTGNAYLTGFFSGTASFGTHTLTSSGGADIFVAKLSPGTPVEDELNPPALHPALSASPNPFAASTVIRVESCKPEGWSGNASVMIYNLKGQAVRSLLLASTDGSYLTWDGRDERGLPCPNGIYLALLDLGGRRATLKLSLIK